VCSRHVLISMLSGMFDGDGHSSRHNGTVGYSSASGRLIDQLRVLLANFGIITKTSLNTRLQRRPLDECANRLHPVYQLALSTINSCVFYDEIGFKTKRKQQQRSKLPKHNYRLSNPSVLWLPIESLTPSKSPTVDIEVPSCGYFTANALLSSNSQIARTVILAYIKKEGRDKKNSNAYRDHSYGRHHQTDGAMARFLTEARAVCQFNDDFLKIIDTIERLYQTDERPYDGIISKIIEASKLSRITVVTFFHMIRLRSLEFSDSPMNRTAENIKIERRLNVHAESDDG
jgi:hypothetical protein